MVKEFKKLPAQARKGLIGWFMGTVALAGGVSAAMVYISNTLQKTLALYETQKVALEQKKVALEQKMESLRTASSTPEAAISPICYGKRCAKLEKEGYDIVSFLETIEVCIPNDVRLKGFTFEHKKSLRVQGQGCTQAGINKFISALRQHYKKVYLEDYCQPCTSSQSYTTFSLMIPL